MNKQSDNTMSTQEFHDKQFKELVVQHYKQLIWTAKQAEDTEQLAQLTKELEKFEAGDFSVVKNLVFVIAGSKIYYDEKQKKVITAQLTYTVL